MKKLLLQASLVLLLCLFAFSCGKDEPNEPVAKTATIKGFNPTSGPVGTSVTINGTNFGATEAGNTVKFGAVAATVNSASASSLKVTVPEGAQTATISVTVDGKTATSADAFTVTVDLGPTTLSLDKETLELRTTETEMLTPTVGGNGANNTVVWSSDNEAAAVVDQEGNVTATGAGTATITATVDEVTASCAITVDPSIFVVGTTTYTANGPNAIALWVNGEFQEIAGTESDGFSPNVAVSNGDIYISYAEHIVDDDTQMKVLKNGNPMSEWNFGAWPENGGYERVPTSLEVVASDIYVGGYEFSYYGNELNEAGYWQSATEKTVLIDAISQLFDHVQMEDIVVKNNIVYAAGYYMDYGFNYGCYFVGEELHVIGNDQLTGVKLSSLDIDSSEDIYTAGSINNVATVWKNGSTLYTLGTEGIYSTLDDIKVMDENIVSVGWEENQGGKIWLNGQVAHEWADGSAQSVSIHNGLAYITGHQSGVAKVWIMDNLGSITEEISLPSNTFSVGYSIIVK